MRTVAYTFVARDAAGHTSQLVVSVDVGSAGWPTPATTGVPAGTTLTNDNRSTLSTANELVVGKRFATRLSCTANGVVLRNCELTQGIDNWSGQGSFTLEDCTVGPTTPGTLVFGVGATAFTARRCLVRNCLDGFRVSGRDQRPILIEDCFVVTSKASGAHSDGVQADGNQAPWTFRHNTVDLRPSATDWTACVFNGSSGSTGTATIVDNLLIGGGYSLQLNTASAVIGNRIVQGAWEYGPVSAESAIIAAWSDNQFAQIGSGYAVASVGASVPRP